MATRDDNNGPPAPGSVWLEVQHDGRARTFCRAPDDERAVVVGSLPRADVHISGLTIAPVHFHFEREGDRVLLVPAYNADVRVNSMLARGPVSIPSHAAIEFAGIRMDVLVHSTAPVGSDHQSLDIPDRESGIQYLSALPTDTQTTKLALEAFTRVENLQAAIETRETPLEFRADVSRTQRIERAAQIEPALQTTQVMERLQVVTAAIPAIYQQTIRMERVAPEALRGPKIEPTPVIEVQPLRPGSAGVVAPTEQQLAPPPREVPSSPAGLGWQETTAFDLDGLKADLAPTPALGVQASPSWTTPEPPEAARSEYSRVPVERSAPPFARSVRPCARATSKVLVRLGQHAKARPAVVAVSAFAAAAVLALAMAGISRVAGSHAKSPGNLAAQAAKAATLVDKRDGSMRPALNPTPSPGLPPIAVAIAPTPASPANAELATSIPLLTSAASHLVGGRYVEARAVYAQLAAAQPNDPTYQTLSRLLDRRTGAACSGATAPPFCPEIIP